MASDFNAIDHTIPATAKRMRQTVAPVSLAIWLPALSGGPAALSGGPAALSGGPAALSGGPAALSGGPALALNA